MATEVKRRRERPTPTQARAARRERRQRKRRFKRFAAFAAVGIVAVLFIAALFVPGLQGIISPPVNAPDGPGERFPDQGAAHIKSGEGHPPYNSVPGTSGWHYDYPDGGPARWGVYQEPLADEVLIHNLEHGGIGIHYDCPDGCDDLAEQLEGFFQTGLEIIVSPYPEMDSRIAVTAWTFRDGFDEFDRERIEAFIDSHLNSPNAPEYLAR